MQPVSVIATVLNEVEEFGRLVPSLLGQIPPPAEVVIVDGGSTDGTWERLLDEARRHPNLMPIRDESCNLKRSPGPIARGRNVAIAAARSTIVACADAGCTYAADWLTGQSLRSPGRVNPHLNSARWKRYTVRTAKIGSSGLRKRDPAMMK